MLKRAACIALFLLPFSQSHASDALERIEAISEDMTSLMFDAMLTEMGAEGVDTSKLAELVPSTEWDEPMRDAGRCVLDRFTARIGDDGVDAMLDQMEARLPEIRAGGMQAIDQLGSLLPEGISEAEADAINSECGMTRLIREKMMNPEFMSAVMSLMSEN
ncbi:MAG: hypothetical protein AAGA11_12720 [Pseudomonadota bacterium]